MLAGSYHGRNQTMMMRCWDLKKKPNNYMNCKSFIWVILTLCCVIVSKIQIPVDYAVLYQALLCYLKLCCVTSCLAVWLLALLCDLLLCCVTSSFALGPVGPLALMCDIKICCVTSVFVVWSLALFSGLLLCFVTPGFNVWPFALLFDLWLCWMTFSFAAEPFGLLWPQALYDLLLRYVTLGFALWSMI